MIAARSRSLLIGVLGSLLALSVTASARADNPYESELRRLMAETSRARNSPRAILPLLEAWQQWDRVRPEVAMRELERIATDRRLSPAVRNYARALRAEVLLRRGELDRVRSELDTLGVIRDWRVIGPFDNEGKGGFDREYPPEAERMGPVDLDARHRGKVREVSWRAYPDVSPLGLVSFDAVFRPNRNVCAYAETFVESERAEPLTLFIGAGGAVRVWWNGEVVHEDPLYRAPHRDRSVAMVGAHAGLNRLLVKACAAEGRWGFYLRIGDARGEPIDRIRITPDAAPERVASIAPGSGVARLPRPPVTPLDALRAAAEGERARAAALEEYARFLVWTHADDPAVELAREASARAAAMEPTVRRLLLASALARTRGESMRLAEQALERAPRDPDALLASAVLASQGPSPEAALPILERIPHGSRQWMEGELLAAEVLRTLGLPETARARTRAAAALAPGSPWALTAMASAAGGAERKDELIALRQELVGLRHDDLGSRRVLIDDALARGDAEAALEHLAVLRRLAADRSSTYRTAARIYEALDRMDEAFAALRQGIEVAPEEPSLYVAYGRALLRAGQRDAGAAELRQALALAPQDASTRELLEQIQPEERRDEAFAATPEALFARRGPSGGYPITVLQDLTVNTVFESGLGSSFRQVAVQIHDEEGARQWRTYAIQFDPDVQRVDIRQARVFREGQQLSATRTFEQQLGEPWYRIYYDTRARIVVFPDLEPGDVVEIRYRVDDIAERNLFDDYYGDMRMLQMAVPVKRLDYVLITPKSRRFYFNDPEMEGLTHEAREDGSTRIDHFRVENVPALRSEPSMPGMTEVAPYLHVSTYESWEDVGRWYWGLIQDQLHADERLRRIVRELVQDAPDTRTKVARIYDWVIRNTRYVGLEFGIHGYLPYRVPDVVSRGFGDCKDKASLIYTMLREAGIDARFVLIRTRRNGKIEDEPASLAIFDHAIAYVPELDLYLDGTAEHSGLEELPQMDQGVTVLRVGPDDVVFDRTPVLGPDHNRRLREITMTLAPDGSGTIELSEELRGAEAPGYRSRFQAQGLRTERLERQMRSLFPGLELSESRFENLDDYNLPVRLRFRAEAPQLAIRDGRLLRVAPTTLNELVATLARASTRRHPLDLGLRSTYVEERRIRLPRGYRIFELPEGGEARSEFGRLIITPRQDGRDVVVRTELVIDRDRIAPDDYPAFRRWVQEADRIVRQRITLAPGGES